MVIGILYRVTHHKSISRVSNLAVFSQLFDEKDAKFKHQPRSGSRKAGNLWMASQLSGLPAIGYLFLSFDVNQLR